MAKASFLQTSFLGGVWSPSAQGRMTDPAWKTALNVCTNAFPLEEGSWTRRPGFRYLQHTRQGQAAQFRSFDFEIDAPYVAEFTPLKVRFFQGASLVTEASATVLSITADNPAKVILGGELPDNWANGDTVIFTLSQPYSAPILLNRQFAIADCDSSGTFTLRDPITGDDIDGASVAWDMSGAGATVAKVHELVTPYTADDLAKLRIVSDDSTVLILHPSYQPRVLTKADSPLTFAIATQDFSDGPYLDIQDLKVTQTTLTLSGLTGSVTVTASDTNAINDGIGFKSTDVGRLIRFQGGPAIWDKSTSYHKGDQVTGSDGNIYVAQGGMTGVDPTLDDGTHWVLSSAKVNWIWLKITAFTDTTHVTATVESDLRDNGTFATVEGDANIRAAIGSSGLPTMQAQYPAIDFTQYFAPGQAAVVSNGAFTDGSGGDVSGNYTVKGAFNDPDDRRSVLVFTDEDGASSSWSVVAGLSDSRTAYYSPNIGQTLAGDELTTTYWRLGAFSDTTGWPACGTYHEGRLWLSGAQSNRVDASKSDDHFNFSPTDTDGTVAADNAIAAIANATDLNTFFWMLSGDNGILLGSLASEWLIRSSAQDDPLAPDNIQMRRITSYGCADIEPQFCLRTVAFVQRQQKRVLDIANYPWGEAAGWYADNLEHLASSLTAPGVAEIRYQQTPCWNLWSRMNDGSLVGATFRHATYGKESFNGWHSHAHGGSRIFESLAVSSTPTDTGLGETLYAVTNQTDSDAPDVNVRWVEMLSPQFDDGAEDCDAFLVDGAVTGSYVVLTGGNPPTGLRIYGLWHLNGKTVSAFIGGLDLGDFTVSNGSIDITFGAANGADGAGFTWAYFQTLTACDLLGANAGLTVNTIETPPVAQGSLMAIIGAEGSVGYPASGGFASYSHAAGRAIHHCVGGSTDGLILLSTNPPGDEILEATNLDIFGDAGGGTPNHTVLNSGARCFHPHANQYFCTVDGASNSAAIAKINGSTLVSAEIAGTSSASLSPSTCDSTGKLTRLLLSSQMIAANRGNTNYLVCRATASPEVAILNVTTNGNMRLIHAVNIDEDVAMLVPGINATDYCTFYALGRLSSYGAGAADPIGVYEYTIYADELGANKDTNVYVNPNAAVRRRKIGTVAPSDIDATWTEYTGVFGPGFDQADGNLLCVVTSPSGPTNRYYLVKINSQTAEVMWTSPLASSGVPGTFDLPQCNIKGTFAYFDATGGNHVKTVDLSDGTQTSSVAWATTFGTPAVEVFDYLTGSITMNAGFTYASGTVPTYIGDYLANNSDIIPTDRWARLYNGTAYSSQTTTEYPVYGGVGFTFTSDGQILRPDFQGDAGTREGPSFGKTRRAHAAGIGLVRTQKIRIGIAFDNLHDVVLRSSGAKGARGASLVTVPSLYTGTVAAKDCTIGDNLGTESMLCWRVTRPYPATVTAIAGLIESAEG